MSNRNRLPPRHRAGGKGFPMSRAQRKAKHGPPQQPVEVDTTKMAAISKRIEASVDAAVDAVAEAIGRIYAARWKRGLRR